MPLSPNERKRIGARGENFAAAVYERAGCEIVARNYRTRGGEVDLIVREGETLCFVEVKTRCVGSMTTPAEAVTPAKQRRLWLAAGQYISETGCDGAMRFDVFELYIEDERPVRYRILKNAFSPDLYGGSI